MKFSKGISLGKLAQLIDAKVIGDADAMVYGINEIHKVESGDITFCDVEKYFKKSFKSAASFVIVNKEVEAPVGKSLLYCADPFLSYNKIVRHFYHPIPLSAQISETANIHPSAIIEPNVIIGHRVKIGAYTHIRANVVIHDMTSIGSHVIIQSGTVIGTDAFYYKRRSDGYDKMYSCGRVLIEDRVEIGASCTIDRGVSGDTIIGAGTKIDNHVHIAHGVVVGKDCLFAAQVGVAGKTIIGDRVKLWGQVGIATNLILGDDVEVYAQSGVSHNLPSGKAYFGSPAIEAKEWFSDYRAIKRAPREIKDLKDRLE